LSCGMLYQPSNNDIWCAFLLANYDARVLA
jgi:hypothetical protein